MKVRSVRPEILDSLSPDHSDAIANRRDLRFLNRFMGNWAWISKQVDRFYTPGKKITEAGAGEGDLGFYLRGRCERLDFSDYQGLDLWERPKNWPTEAKWVSADLFEFEPEPCPDIFIVNLLLHQFEDERLRALGEQMERFPVWIVNEPLRVRWAVWGLACMRLFGLHPVSWHDGRVSIGAGFRGEELADLLGARKGKRQCRISRDVRGGYRMISWIES